MAEKKEAQRARAEAEEQEARAKMHERGLADDELGDSRESNGRGRERVESCAELAWRGDARRTGIQHVALETRREDGRAAEAFWALLGFERGRAAARASRGRAGWLERAGTQVHLLFATATRRPPHPRATSPSSSTTTTRRCSACARPATRSRPRASTGARPRAFARAPGGHRVELMAAPAPGRNG